MVSGSNKPQKPPAVTAKEMQSICKQFYSSMKQESSQLPSFSKIWQAMKQQAPAYAERKSKALEKKNIQQITETKSQKIAEKKLAVEASASTDDEEDSGDDDEEAEEFEVSSIDDAYIKLAVASGSDVADSQRHLDTILHEAAETTVEYKKEIIVHLLHQIDSSTTLLQLQLSEDKKVQAQVQAQVRRTVNQALREIQGLIDNATEIDTQTPTKDELDTLDELYDEIITLSQNLLDFLIEKLEVKPTKVHKTIKKCLEKFTR